MASRGRIKTGTIEVEGLAQLSKALKELDPQLQKELRGANKEVADDVAQGARSRAASELGAMGAHFAPGIKASAGAQSAGVALDGRKYPGILGAEFGAGQDRERDRKTGRYMGFRQFEPWRGNSTGAGYFLYPTIRDRAPDISNKYEQLIDDLIKKAGLNE